jgi:glycosyltransferase involved in cell wall biosynthesis
MKEKLYIVIPAYNESANIERIVTEWHPIVKKIGNGSKLVIIDDGSKDETYAILKQLQQKYKLLDCVKKKNSGHGATVLFGYKYALKEKADYIFQTDSDGQTDPAEFWQFWEKRNKYDAIIGHRNHRQDGLSRVIVTRVLRFVIRLKFGVKVTDANTPFRLMTAKSLRENIRYVPDGFNLSNVILSVIYAKRKQKIVFIPITFRPRQGGKNSINVPKIFGIAKRALKDFSEINKTLKQMDKTSND